MTLKEIFEHLAYGELSSVYLGELDAETGELREANKHKLLSHINAGLDAIYGRFNLRNESFKVIMTPGMLRYPLYSKYAYSAKRSGIKFIDDSFSDFDHPFISVLRITDPDGNEIPLNMTGDPNSITTPQTDAIEVPEALNTSLEYVTVHYKAGCRHLTEYDLGVDSAYVEIPLPYLYLEALGYFVASRVFNPVGMASQEMVQGTNYTMMFEAACNRLRDSSAQIYSGRVNTRAERGGWI